MKAELLFLGLIITLASATPLSSQEPDVSNEIFVRNSFQNLADSLLESLNPPSDLILVFKCSDCPIDFFRNILVSVLKQKVTSLYIDNGEQNCDKLEINLYNYNFHYGKAGGSLFSSGRLTRNFNAAAFAVLLDTDSKVIWQNEVEENFSQKVGWENAREWEKPDNGLFKAPLPSTSRSRIWEPVIITGLLGGLVYLFFASR